MIQRTGARVARSVWNYAENIAETSSCRHLITKAARPFSPREKDSSTKPTPKYTHTRRETPGWKSDSPRTGPRRNSPSRRSAPPSNSERNDNLPRYLRRQAEFGKPHIDSEAVVKKTYPSRFASEKPKSTNLRLLEPHVLSTRLKKLCEQEKVDEAVSMLKNAPLDAQNTPVWNTLIWECMKAQRFSLAYQLFIDMKRRGFSPTTRSYQTMFSGLSRIEHWSSHPKQLAHAQSLYEAFIRHLEAVKNEDETSPELSTTPLTFYLKILGDAGKYQEVFDVYYAMDSTGPLAPNVFIFTAMFNAMARRKNSQDSSVALQNAFDPKMLWIKMLETSQKVGFKVDGHLISAAINALMRGRPADQAYAFNLAREHFGLVKPGDPKSPCTLPLEAAPFSTILTLCNVARKYTLSVYFFRQVLDRPLNQGGPEIIDKGHVEELLKSYVSMAARGSPGEGEQALRTLEWMLKREVSASNGPKIRPAASTFNLVMMACWRASDWHSAARTFQLMTGYRSACFKDGSTEIPKMEKRSAGRNLIPTAETMSCMLRAALADGERENMRQCLRMVTFVGGEHLFDLDPREAATSRKAAKQDTFYRIKLATAFKSTIDQVFRKSIDDGSEETLRWKSLANSAGNMVRNITPSFATPELERDVDAFTESELFENAKYSAGNF